MRWDGGKLEERHDARRTTEEVSHEQAECLWVGRSAWPPPHSAKIKAGFFFFFFLP